MSGNTDMHLLVKDAFKKKVGTWIIKPVSIWCYHHLPSHRVDQAVDLYLLWMPISCCQGNSYSSWSHDMTCLVTMQAMEELDIFSLQKLYTDPCEIGLCIVMLKHEVTNGTSQYLCAFKSNYIGPIHIFSRCYCGCGETLVPSSNSAVISNTHKS
jgi:hypothetical protein